jgi:hypothetical protein
MGHVNPPITPKQWAIAQKNGHKCKNDEFLVMPVKHAWAFKITPETQNCGQ